jgi:small basic protein (TIGR04137 family)
MSLDRSLKTAGGLFRHRNVLKRTERLAELEDEGRWDDSQSVYGLPKVAHRKTNIGGKSKKAKGEEKKEGEGEDAKAAES